ncbi:MAG TPA: DNA-3-methyladenine glycosylase [Candidatus Angelobacter sp.]|nr:DNA-3-methyladenine glycosylase [Candidatus Angelobacter sp.]
MKKALTHLQGCDPVLASIIARVGPFRMAYREPTFEALARAIVFQQLSGKAARTIYERFEAAAGGAVTPEAIRNLTVGEMRRCGLSQQKIGYIRDLADHALEGKLDFDRLPKMADEEVIAVLTDIKGIGVWTAHMFLMFALRRPNVLPVGDLGVRSAIKRAYRKRTLPSPKQVEKIAQSWHPWCSVASWYLWRSLDTATLEESAPKPSKKSASRKKARKKTRR